jgi:hypothetical protein
MSKGTALPISLAAALSAIVSAVAHAEYRCATPEQLTPAEQRACELAREDTPDALVHFVNRTKGTENLIVNDYVSSADEQRWETARDGDAREVSADGSLPRFNGQGSSTGSPGSDRSSGD